MNKKIKQPHKASATIETDFEDFFTQYLEKKKRNYYKKLDKVAMLVEKNVNTLTIEQKSMIANKQKMQDEINYYEEIKQHYFKALKKKDPEIFEKGAEPQKETVSEDNLADSCKKVLSLYYSNLSNMDGLESDIKETLKTYREGAFGVEAYDEQNQQQTETSLLNFLKDVTVSNKLIDYVNNSLVTKQEEEPVKEEKKEKTPEKQLEQVPVVKENTEEVKTEKKKEEEEFDQQQTTKKKSINKPTLFVMSSDEEDEEESVRKESITSNAKQLEKKEEKTEVKEEEPGMKIKPLPEDSDEEFGDFTGTGNNNRGKRRRNRNRNKKEQGEGYSKHKRKHKGYKPNQKDGFKQKVVSSYQRKE